MQQSVAPGKSFWPVDGGDEPSWGAGTFPEDSVRAAAEAWLGVPYRYGGEGPDSIDCSALVRAIYQRVAGLALPRRAAGQALQGYGVTREALAPGDLVFFVDPGGAEIGHVGLYLGMGRFVNATVSRGVAYSSLDEPYWKERYRKAVRVVLPLRKSID